VRDTDLTAYAHQDVPFEILVEELNPQRSLGRHPLFQTMLVLQNTSGAEARMAGLETEPPQVVALESAKFDLTFDLTEHHDASGAPRGLTGVLTAATDLFDRTTAERLAERWLALLADLVSGPEDRIGDVDLLTPAERAALQAEQQVAERIPEHLPSVHGRFRDVAARHAGSTALVCGEERLTYGELDTVANRFAHHLIDRGVTPGSTVAVLVDRDVRLVVALLGALKAGAGYTLLDPQLPAARLHAVTEQAEVGHLVTTTGQDTSWLGAGVRTVLLDDEDTFATRPAWDPAVEVSPLDTACVMFTSGSTGAPKGVVTPHRALVGTLTGQNYAEFGPGEVWLQCSPVSWDAFALELFGPLLHGATCVLHPGSRVDPERVASLIERHRVGAAYLSSGLFNHLLDTHPGVFDAVRCVVTGGEALSVPHVARALQTYPSTRLVNGYGPLETTVFATTHPVSRQDTSPGPVPVGAALTGKPVLVLDERLRPVPPGVVGEVYVAGFGLARGYAGQRALTAERFVANPYGPPGSRMYRSGDLGRRRADGILEHHGRSDHQVKIRGFRIEPAEVEKVLVGHPAVQQAVVVPREGAGGVRLVAYVVADGARCDAEVLGRHAEAALPPHLVPSGYVFLDRLPLTGSGKVDRSALPAPGRESTRGSGRAPSTREEAVLCDLFADVLGLDTVGADDDFFRLGGHSLVAARLSSRVRSVLGVEVGVAEVFRFPTASALACHLAVADRARSVLARCERPEVLPLSAAQQRLWFLERTQGPNASYHVPFLLRLTGALEVSALRSALGDVMERHESLRTVFPESGDAPQQRVLQAPSAEEVCVPAECEEADVERLA
ncbi:non-ribosomal peptide synthetase, partial [Streptomyces sp. TR02-1]|uniref:non-ribosomal peptide synthetase n=1 Tax=Streptomyces sp. TR02-1 TaxID=3385977 RepID=UPI0039A2AF68